MKFCQLCQKSSLDEITFARKGSLLRYFGLDEVCTECEKDLKEKKPQIKSFSGVSPQQKTNHLTSKRSTR